MKDRSGPARITVDALLVLPSQTTLRGLTRGLDVTKAPRLAVGGDQLEPLAALLYQAG